MLLLQLKMLETSKACHQRIFIHQHQRLLYQDHNMTIQNISVDVKYLVLIQISSKVNKILLIKVTVYRLLNNKCKCSKVKNFQAFLDCQLKLSKCKCKIKWIWVQEVYLVKGRHNLKLLRETALYLKVRCSSRTLMT